MGSPASRTKQLVIYGAGGHGREMAELVKDVVRAGHIEGWELLGFVDDNPALAHKDVASHPILGTYEWLVEQKPRPAVVLGVGAPEVKRGLVARLRPEGFAFPSLVHPSVHMGARVTLGEGSVITAGSVITTDVIIGAFVTLNVGCTVSHDTEIEDFVTIAPGANIAGNVAIGSGAEVGIGAVIIQGVRLGRWSILGAGAVAVSDIPEDVVAVGVPARPHRKRDRDNHED